ncbi:MAG: ATP-binding protein, partial [Saprospiraceae bacterium]|nr:ATP-binding protein [Saprospiraceae bacterium]
MPQSPFKLFEPYGPGDKDIFFGRDAEIFALYHLLQQTRIALIYGASGTGKTSLINAGLPKVFKLTDWFRVFIRRRDNINDSLRGELNRLRGHNEPITDLPQVIHEIFETRWIPIYLVFDQFEEIFTLGTSEERKVFFRDLQQLMTVNLPCKIILSMREEYIGHLYDYEPQVPALFQKRFRVESMQDNTVQEVIAQMCFVNGIELEHPEIAEADTDQSASTAARILEQLKEGKQAAHLPYLQIYLHYLYEHAISTLGKARFTQSSIQAVGKLGNVLKRFIETKLAEAQTFLHAQHAPEDFAQRLLDEFATDEGTKQSRKRGELGIILDVPPGLVQVALGYFSDTAKLLRADEDEVDRYEPVHDVVAKQIHELRTAEDKEFKAFTRHLQLSCDRWLAEQRPTDRLLPERDLSRADIYRERLERR